MTRIVIALTAILCITTNTFANYCSTRVIVKKVAVPVAVPVLVPATVFQYLPAVTPSIAVQGAYSQPVVGGYPQAGYAPQVQAPVQSGNDLEARIEAIINAKLDKILKQQKLAVEPEDEGPPPLDLGNDDQSKGPDLLPQVAEMLATKTCVQCHTKGVKVSGSVVLFVKKPDGLYFEPSVTKDRIIAAVKPPPRMPPTARGDPNHVDAIKGSDLQLLYAWLKDK